MRNSAPVGGKSKSWKLRVGLWAAFGSFWLVACHAPDYHFGQGEGESHPSSLPPEPLPGPGDTDGPGGWPDGPVQLSRFELTIDPGYLRALNNDPYAETFYPAHLKAPGYDGPVEVRYRGQGTRAVPKKSWKIEFPDKVRWQGAKKLNLLAEWLDAGFLGDRIAFDLGAAIGATISRTRFIQMTVNGGPTELFLEIEQVDSRFLQARPLDPDANIYRDGAQNAELRLGPAEAWQTEVEKKTNETRADTDWDEWVNALNRVPPHELKSFLESKMDLDAYLASLALWNLTSMLYVEDCGGYWISEHQGQRWWYAPWDLNNSMLVFRNDAPVDSVPWTDRPLPAFTAYDPEMDQVFLDRSARYPGYRPAFNVLATRVIDDPELRARLIEKMRNGMELMAPGRAGPYVQALADAVFPAFATDPYAKPAHLDRAVQYYTRYLAERRAYLEHALRELDQVDARPELVIDAVGPGWVELYNRSNQAVPLKGYHLVSDLRAPLDGELKANLSVPPRGILRLEGKNLPAAIDPNGGELGLHKGNSLAGFEDILYYGPLDPNGYGRSPSGTERYRPR